MRVVFISIASLLLNLCTAFDMVVAQPVYDKDAIEAPLTGEPGDVARGKKIVLNRQVGLCLLCHSGPFPEERFQGDLAPDLALSAGRLSTGQIRARIVDAKRFNPDSIMPTYFGMDRLTRVSPQFAGKSIFSAQDIEDVVAFIASLRK